MAGPCARNVQRNPGDKTVGYTTCYSFRNLTEGSSSGGDVKSDPLAPLLKDSPQLRTKTCREFWSTTSDGAPHLDVVWCADSQPAIVFQPNGEFKYSKMVADFAAREAQESTVISVGKCSVVE
jgi:hypothetical protein